jgi:hypothetical protein
MTSRFRLAAFLLVLAPPVLAVETGSDMIERFDAAVARLPPVGQPSSGDAARAKRSAADFAVERRFNVRLDFPGGIQGAMYGGFLDGDAAVFTRAGNFLDATVLRRGDIDVTSFDGAGNDGRLAVPTSPASGAGPQRSRRSVGPGHFEDPGAYSLHVYFLKHDDLTRYAPRELHARFVAWWLADMSTQVLPVEPLRASYAERVPWLTSMAYGDARSLDTFERTLKALDSAYEFDMDRTYKKKFVLLTAEAPMPGTAGVAYEGGNEAIASVAGRARIVAHEIGHMLGARHEDSEMRGWWGCDTNMVPKATAGRGDCLQYSAANQRAMRSYMRHGPDTTVPKRMADAPTP